jgi:hypothetical protein
MGILVLEQATVHCPRYLGPGSSSHGFHWRPFLRLGHLLLIPKEVGDVALVRSAVDGNDKLRRVVPNLANVLAHGIAFQFTVVRLKERLQIGTPFFAVRVQPCLDAFRAVVQNNRHPPRKSVNCTHESRISE